MEKIDSRWAFLSHLWYVYIGGICIYVSYDPAFFGEFVNQHTYDYLRWVGYFECGYFALLMLMFYIHRHSIRYQLYEHILSMIYAVTIGLNILSSTIGGILIFGDKLNNSIVFLWIVHLTEIFMRLYLTVHFYRMYPNREFPYINYQIIE
jgi:hypothetical protein